jgi:hypothetical protein
MKTKKFKLAGLPSEREFNKLPFGRQLEHLRAIEAFKMSCKSVYLSQKRQTYQKAIKEAIASYGVKEYYCEFYCSQQCKDDTFQFWYR